MHTRGVGRRVTFEYTLLGGVNDSVEHARMLVATLRRYRLASHVNLIPYNPVDGAGFARPSRNAVMAFSKAVEADGRARAALPICGCSASGGVRERVRGEGGTPRARRCGCSVRQTRGLEAAAACGQLRNQYQSRSSEPAPL